MMETGNINGKTAYGHSNKTPWGKSGISVPGLMTVKEALVVGGLDWNVEKRNVMTDDLDMVKIPNIYAVGRVGPELDVNGEKKFIPFNATVKKRYTIVQNIDAFSFFDTALYEGVACIESVGAIGNGERVFAIASLPETFEPLPGEAMKRYIMLTTSHDGSSNIMAIFTTVRMSCTNMMSSIICDAKNRKNTTNIVSIRHTKNANKRIAEAHKIMDVSGTYWERLAEAFKSLAMRDMSRLDVMDFVGKMFPGKIERLPKQSGGFIEVERVATRTQNNRDKLITLFDGEAMGSNSKISGSAYQMYNAATEFTDHHKNVNKTTERWESSAFGSGSSFREKAFNELLKI